MGAACTTPAMEQVLIALGMLGTVTVVGTFAAVSAGKLQASSARYQWLNVLGTAAVLLSLIVQYNRPSFILNSAWLAIGVFSLVRIYRKRKSS